MNNKHLVNILGKYFGKIVSTTIDPTGVITIITRKLKIHKAEPVTYLPKEKIIEKINKLREEALQQKASIFLVLANVEYDRYRINQDDILPTLSADADTLIVLRDNNWNKLPLEAIGIPHDDVDKVSKYYTMYIAMKHALLKYHQELDRYRAELIKYAELAEKATKLLSERDRIVVDLQSKMSELNLQIYSLNRSIENMEKLIELSGKEADIWRKAYMELKEKVSELLNLVPTVIEYVNRLAAVELEREVETGTLKQRLSMLDQKVQEAVREVEELRYTVQEIKKLQEKPKEEKKEEKPEKEEGTKEEKEGGEEEGEGEVFV